MKKLMIIAAFAGAFSAGPCFAEAYPESTESLKAQILQLAKSYEGQGDPDQSKQKNLENIVDKLVRQNPMPPIKDRIPILAGAWKQVWGPYDYRNDDGGIDPVHRRSAHQAEDVQHGACSLFPVIQSP